MLKPPTSKFANLAQFYNYKILQPRIEELKLTKAKSLAKTLDLDLYPNPKVLHTPPQRRQKLLLAVPKPVAYEGSWL
jgi:hypothetical protein